LSIGVSRLPPCQAFPPTTGVQNTLLPHQALGRITSGNRDRGCPTRAEGSRQNGLLLSRYGGLPSRASPASSRWRAGARSTGRGRATPKKFQNREIGASSSTSCAGLLPLVRRVVSSRTGRASGKHVRASDEGAIGPIISSARWQRSAGILQGPRFRCLARGRAAANLNRRPRDAPRDLQARQPLLARPVRTSGLVVLISSRRWERYGLKPWIEAAKKCLLPNGWRSHLPTRSPALLGGSQRAAQL
jgi:hypothetical protein